MANSKLGGSACSLNAKPYKSGYCLQSAYKVSGWRLEMIKKENRRLASIIGKYLSCLFFPTMMVIYDCVLHHLQHSTHSGLLKDCQSSCDVMTVVLSFPVGS